MKIYQHPITPSQIINQTKYSCAILETNRTETNSCTDMKYLGCYMILFTLFRRIYDRKSINGGNIIFENTSVLAYELDWLKMEKSQQAILAYSYAHKQWSGKLRLYCKKKSIKVSKISILSAVGSFTRAWVLMVGPSWFWRHSRVDCSALFNSLLYCCLKHLK